MSEGISDAMTAFLTILRYIGYVVAFVAAAILGTIIGLILR